MSPDLDEIEADAEEVRVRVGIRPDAAAPDVESALRAMGLVVVHRPLGPGSPEAIYLGPGLVLVASGGLAAHRRFVSAHLLAHHLYQDEPHLERGVEHPWHDRCQERANAFAERFLVSREALRLRAPDTITPGDVWHLAAEFQVGCEVMLRRLVETRSWNAGERTAGPVPRWW